MVSKWEKFFWSFLRGEMPVEEFEASIYAAPELEDILGSDDYLKIISYDYRLKRDYGEFLWQLQNIVRRHFPRSCECMSIGQRGRMRLGTVEAESIERAEVLYQESPWLDLRHCPDCGAFWYVATDPNEEEFLLYRMSREEVETVAERGEFPDVSDYGSFGWPSSGSYALGGHSSVEEWHRAKNTPEMLDRLRLLLAGSDPRPS